MTSDAALRSAVRAYLSYLHSDAPLNDDFRLLKQRVITAACVVVGEERGGGEMAKKAKVFTAEGVIMLLRSLKRYDVDRNGEFDEAPDGLWIPYEHIDSLIDQIRKEERDEQVH